MTTRSVDVLAGIALVCVFTIGSSRAFQFGPGAGTPQPTLLRLIGFVGSAPDGVETLGSVTVRVDHTMATLALAEVQMLNGPLTEGRAALRQTELYTPNLVLIGSRVLLTNIREAPEHARITVFGYLSGNARRLFVVEVQRS